MTKTESVRTAGMRSFVATVIVTGWCCAFPIGYAWALWRKWETVPFEFADSMKYWGVAICVMLLTLGFDIITILRQAGFIGSKGPKPQPFYNVDPPSNTQTPERPDPS